MTVATGARPYAPDLPADGSVEIVTAWDILEKRVKPGRNVVVVDWRSDWIGPGIAELLTRGGSRVTLAVNAPHPGEVLPLYVRDNIAAELHRRQVKVMTRSTLGFCSR